MDRISTQMEIKQVSDQRIISGFAAAGGLDRVGDVIDMSCAFTKTLSEKPISDVAVFIGHVSDALPVGIPIKIEPTPDGLFTETRVFDGPAGDNLLAVARGLMAHGKTLGLSIGYRLYPNGAEMARVEGKMVRKLTAIDLREYSFASAATIANPRALTVGVKQRDQLSDAEQKAAMGSFDWIRGQVQEALAEANDCGCGIEALFPDRVIYHKYPMGGMGGMGGGEDELYQASYTMSGDTVTLGDPVQVDTQYTPMPAGVGDKTAEEADAMENKANWDTAYVNNLPDSAFLYVQSGGQKDDSGKTVPRNLRHFPYKGSDGNVDLPHLRNAIARIPQSNAPGLNADALQARAQRMLENMTGSTSSGKTIDIDAPEWVSGVSLDISSIGYRVLEIAEDLADEQKAMRLLGEDVKDGKRIRAETRGRISTAIKQLEQLVRWAELADEGADQKAVVDRYARELDLLSV